MLHRSDKSQLLIRRPLADTFLACGLGHRAALTIPRMVIHFRAAATLPFTQGGLYLGAPNRRPAQVSKRKSHGVTFSRSDTPRSKERKEGAMRPTRRDYATGAGKVSA